MTNIFTKGWVITDESDNFANFSKLSYDEKRTQHLIDNVYLPYQQAYRIYQKDKNIVIAFKVSEWKFIKNRFFIKTKFETIATITPTRIFTNNIGFAANIICKHLGFTPSVHVNKILLRQIIKKGKKAYDDYLIKHEEEIYCYKYGFHWDDIVTYSDNPKLFVEKIKQTNHIELFDLLRQAKMLNKIIKMSWSSRRMHDEHIKWTEEIHKIKTRNCSTEPIWKNCVKLPENVILLNSEKEIAKEGSSMHHCIYTNYCDALKNKRMVAFHVINENKDFTCSFRIINNQVQFDQAYKAWNKKLTNSEMEIAQSLKNYVTTLITLNPIEQKKQIENQSFDDDLEWF